MLEELIQMSFVMAGMTNSREQAQVRFCYMAVTGEAKLL